jgi:hypothetical protein
MANLSTEAKNGLTWKDCLVEIYEVALVGAGIGGGFDHSSELNVLKYNQAMRSNDLEQLSKWIKGMDEEHARFLFNEVWIVVLKGDCDSHYDDMGFKIESEWGCASTV